VALNDGNGEPKGKRKRRKKKTNGQAEAHGGDDDSSNQPPDVSPSKRTLLDILAIGERMGFKKMSRPETDKVKAAAAVRKKAEEERAAQAKKDEEDDEGPMGPPVRAPQLELVNGEMRIIPGSLETMRGDAEADHPMEEIHEDAYQTATYSSYANR